MNMIVRFLHPLARRNVARVLCLAHYATARSMCDDVEPGEGSWAECDWCKPGDKLRARVAREFFEAGMVTA